MRNSLQEPLESFMEQIKERLDGLSPQFFQDIFKEAISGLMREIETKEAEYKEYFDHHFKDIKDSITPK
jgi:uncharacterized membrane protein YheB (UPF0754 family)